MKLLINEPPLQVLPTLARRAGLNEAIVAQQLQYITFRQRGRPPEKTLKELHDEFPFWEPRTIQRATASLRAQGLLTVEQPRGRDRRNRYILNHEAIDRLAEEDDLMTTDCRDATRQPDVMHDADESSSSAPDRRDAERQDVALYIEKEETATAEVPPGAPGGTRTVGKGGTATTQAAPKDKREDVEKLCEFLAKLVRENGRPPHLIGWPSEGWRKACRLMLDRDSRDPREAWRLIRWCQSDDFWRSNVLGMPKFREQYDQLRLRAFQTPGGRRQMRPLAEAPVPDDTDDRLKAAMH